MKFNNNLSVESQPWAKRISMDIDSLLKRVTAQGTIVETNTKYLSGIGNTVGLLDHRIEAVENAAADRNNLFADLDAALTENEEKLEELYTETLPALEDELEQAALDVAAAMQAAQDALDEVVDAKQIAEDAQQVANAAAADATDAKAEVATATTAAQNAINAAANAQTTADGANARLQVPVEWSTFEWEPVTGANNRSVRRVGSTIVDRNWAANPSFEGGTSGWAGINTGTLGTTFFGAMWRERYGGTVGDRSAQFTASSTGPQCSYIVSGTDVRPPVTPGEWVAVSALAATEQNSNCRVRIALGFYNSSGVFVSGHYGTFHSGSFYAGARPVEVAEVPAGAVSVRIELQLNGVNGSLTAGHRAWFDAVHLGIAGTEAEALSKVTAYFDGDTPAQYWPVSGMPTTRSNGTPLMQGDEAVLINEDGDAVGVKVWNGYSWVSQQLMAESILVPGSAGSTVIADGAITTDKIVANAITGEKVAAQTLTADKLIISSGENMLPWNPAAGALPHGHAAPSTSPLNSTLDDRDGWVITQEWGGGSTADGTMANAIQLRSGTVSRYNREGDWDIEGDTQYELRLGVARRGGNAPTGGHLVRARFIWINADGTNGPAVNGDSVTVPFSNLEGSSFGWAVLSAKAPADAVGLRIYIQRNFWTAGQLRIKYATLRKAVGATLIEDGSITTPKVVAGAIIGDHVAANTLTASKLVVGNPQNMIIDPNFERSDMWSSSSATYNTGGYEGARRITLPTGTGQRGAYLGAPGNEALKEGFIPVTPGETYFVKAKVRGGSVITAGTSHACIYVRYTGADKDSTFSVTAAGQVLTNIPGGTWGDIEGSFTVPENAHYVSVGFFSQTAYPSVMWYSVPTLRKSVGATLIEDGAVSTDKIAANAITGDKVVANSVAGAVGSFLSLSAGQITSGTLNANRIASNTINADKLASNAVLARHLNVVANNASTGRTMTFDSTGLKIYVDDGSEPAISLGADSSEYFSITDNSGNTTISMSPDGKIVAGGFELSGGMSWRGEDMEDVINAMPRGVIAGGGRTLSGTIPAGGRIGFGQITFTPEAGRAYKLTTHGPSLNPGTGGYFDLQTRWASGSAPLHTATVDTVCRVYNGEGWSTPSIQRYLKAGDTIGGATLSPGVPVTVRFDILAVLQNVAISSGQNYFRVYIEDVGASSQYLFNENWTNLSDQIGYPEGDTTPTPPAPKQTVTKTYTATAAESYRGNNAKATGYVWAGKVSQGQFSTVSGGALKGLWVFPNMLSDLSGATISKVELYVENQHTYANAGATAYFHTHGHTSIPTTYSGTTSNTFSSSFSRGQGKWINLNATTYGNGLKSGAIRGFGLYTTGTANYAYFSPTARIRVTYTK